MNNNNNKRKKDIKFEEVEQTPADKHKDIAQDNNYRTKLFIVETEEDHKNGGDWTLRLGGE